MDRSIGRFLKEQLNLFLNMKLSIRHLFAASSLLAFCSCGTLVTYPEAQQASAEYNNDLAALNALSQDYAQLVDSPSARRAWKQDALSTSGLERLVGVWAFKQGEHIDTGLPKLEKAVVIPVQEVNGVSWEAAGDLISVKQPGNDGYIIAFFRK